MTVLKMLMKISESNSGVADKTWYHCTVDTSTKNNLLFFSYYDRLSDPDHEH